MARRASAARAAACSASRFEPPSPSARIEIAVHHLDDEMGRMVGAGPLLEPVDRRPPAFGLKPLLQSRLGVAIDTFVLQKRRPGSEDRRLRSVEPGVQKYGGQHRLAGVGEDGGLAPSAGLRLGRAEPERLVDPQRQRAVRARFLAHQRVEAPREVPLVGARIAAIEFRGDRQPQHAVAHELQPLVVRPAAVDVDAGVIERFHQDRTVSEGVPQAELERVQRSIVRPIGQAGLLQRGEDAVPPHSPGPVPHLPNGRAFAN